MNDLTIQELEALEACLNEAEADHEALEEVPEEDQDEEWEVLFEETSNLIDYYTEQISKRAN